jgi:hypothetical protein
VLALICHIELFVFAHYRQAIEPDAQLSELWKDVFTFHAREESQHAILDELEWMRENGNLTAEQRDRAVEDLIALVGAVDIVSGVQDERFGQVLGGMISKQQAGRIAAALKPIVEG